MKAILNNKHHNLYGNYGAINVFVKLNGRIVIEGTEYSVGDRFYIVDDKRYNGITSELKEIMTSKLNMFLENVIETSKQINRTHQGVITTGFFGESYLDKSGRYEGLNANLAEEIDKIASEHNVEKIIHYFIEKDLNRKSLFVIGGYLHTKLNKLKQNERIACRAYQSQGGLLGASVLEKLDKEEFEIANKVRGIKDEK